MGTLKISDLSVGDWIKVILNKCDYDDAETLDAKVLSIEGNSVGVGYDNSGIVMSAFVDRLTPIRITAEILEKNGVHRTYEDDTYAIFRGDGLWAVKYSDRDWELSTPPVCRVDIKYVHQLQHALRLAGVDKEINL